MDPPSRAAPRHLINVDGRPFDGELPDLRDRLAALSNPNRVAYRNANALAIAHAVSSRLLLVAGPGSGKSFLFLDRIRFWLRQGDAPKIYVASFVRKLVKDLQKEIETRIEDRRGGNVSATTLHTLARSLIERNGGTTELPLEAHVAVLAGWTDLVWRDVLEFHPTLAPGSYGLRRFEAQLHNDAILETSEWRELRATFDNLRSFYNAVGFADMIVTARIAVEENPALVEHSHWIIDEFQDFNTAEERLIRAVTQQASALLVAGDDEQALYQLLKSSHPEIIISYYADLEFAKAMLPYCSRCSYFVCLAAAAFIEAHREETAIAKICLPLEESSMAPKVRVVAAATPTSAVDYIRSFIEDHRAELESHTVAMEASDETDAFLLILTPERTVRFYRSRDADQELRDLVAEWSNPAVSRGKDYWRVADYYAAARRVSDNFAFREVLEHEGRSVSAVHPLLVEALLTGVNLAAVETDFVHEALEKCRGVARIIDSESVTPEQQANQCADLISVDDPKRLASELEANPISSTTDEGDEAIETGGGSSPVELVTIVGAKGLSARHVIVLGCDEVNLARTTPLAFYVALTRARESLHLITAAKAGGAKEANEFVLELPEVCCEFLVHKKSGSPEELAGKSAFQDRLATWAWVSRRPRG